MNNLLNALLVQYCTVRVVECRSHQKKKSPRITHFCCCRLYSFGSRIGQPFMARPTWQSCTPTIPPPGITACIVVLQSLFYYILQFLLLIGIYPNILGTCTTTSVSDLHDVQYLFDPNMHSSHCSCTTLMYVTFPAGRIRMSNKLPRIDGSVAHHWMVKSTLLLLGALVFGSSATMNVPAPYQRDAAVWGCPEAVS